MDGLDCASLRTISSRLGKARTCSALFSLFLNFAGRMCGQETVASTSASVLSVTFILLCPSVETPRGELSSESIDNRLCAEVVQHSACASLGTKAKRKTLSAKVESPLKP